MRRHDGYIHHIPPVNHLNWTDPWTEWLTSWLFDWMGFRDNQMAWSASTGQLASGNSQLFWYNSNLQQFRHKHKVKFPLYFQFYWFFSLHIRDALCRQTRFFDPAQLLSIMVHVLLLWGFKPMKMGGSHRLSLPSLSSIYLTRFSRTRNIKTEKALVHSFIHSSSWRDISVYFF